MRCRVSCAGRAGRLLMSTVCVFVYAVAHLQLELLGALYFWTLVCCLLHSSRREGGDVEFLFRNLSNGVWSGGRKSCKGDGERGNDGGGSEVESWRDVCWRSDGDPRGEGGVGGRWVGGKLRSRLSFEVSSFDRGREGRLSDVEYVEYSLGRWAGMNVGR